MRIVKVTSVFPPYKGGIGQVAYHQAHELAMAGQEVLVFTPHYGSVEKDFPFSVKYLRPLLRWGKAGFCPQLLTKLSRADIVHLHYPSFGLAEIVFLAKKIYRRKFKLVVFYHHDLIGSGWLGSFFRFYSRHFLPQLLKAADRILVSSYDYAENSFVADYYKKSREKFRELPFGVGDEFRPANKDIDLIKKYNITPEDKIILFVGGMDRNHYFKGVDRLIEACSRLNYPSWRLLLVGGGELISTLKKLAGKLKISSRVTFAGWQPDQELPKYYQTADVFVLPSIDQSEAFGLVLIEAMGCGLPVVASSLPGVRSVVDDGATGLLFPPGEADKLALKLDYLLFNEKLRTRFGNTAASLVVERYRWQKVGEGLLGIYRELLSVN